MSTSSAGLQLPAAPRWFYKVREHEFVELDATTTAQLEAARLAFESGGGAATCALQYTFGQTTFQVSLSFPTRSFRQRNTTTGVERPLLLLTAAWLVMEDTSLGWVCMEATVAAALEDMHHRTAVASTPQGCGVLRMPSRHNNTNEDYLYDLAAMTRLDLDAGIVCPIQRRCELFPPSSGPRSIHWASGWLHAAVLAYASAAPRLLAAASMASSTAVVVSRTLEPGWSVLVEWGWRALIASRPILASAFYVAATQALATAQRLIPPPPAFLNTPAAQAVIVPLGAAAQSAATAACAVAAVVVPAAYRLMDVDPMAPPWGDGVKRLVRLNYDEGEYAECHQAFEPTLPSHLRIESIHRVENSSLYRWCRMVRMHIAKENDDDPNTVLVMHGTSRLSPSAVALDDQGIDMRFSRESCFFGRASYFSYNTKYVTDSYAYTPPPPPSATPDSPNGEAKVLQFLVCEVARGRVEQRERNQHIVRPTAGFHSIEGFVSTNVKAVMCYQLFQAYPRFLVTCVVIGSDWLLV